MQTLTFLIQGSQPAPYTVTFKNSDKLTITCDCAAGGTGMLCKHRFNLFSGDYTALVSNNQHDLTTALQWLSNSSIPVHLKELADLEKNMLLLKSDITNKKKQLSRICNES
jgi:hypothetical protein